MWRRDLFQGGFKGCDAISCFRRHDSSIKYFGLEFLVRKQRRELNGLTVKGKLLNKENILNMWRTDLSLSSRFDWSQRGIWAVYVTPGSGSSESTARYCQMCQVLTSQKQWGRWNPVSWRDSHRRCMWLPIQNPKFEKTMRKVQEWLPIQRKSMLSLCENVTEK